MGMRDKGWSVLAEGTTLHKIASSENLPCCTLVAMWCLDVADGVEEISVTRYAARSSMVEVGQRIRCARPVERPDGKPA